MTSKASTKGDQGELDDVFEPRPNGTVRLRLDSKDVTLRRPDFGTYVHLREALIEAGDRQQQVMDEVRQEAEAARAAKGLPTVDAQGKEIELAISQRQQARIQIAGDKALFDWAVEVVQRLGDLNGSTPPIEEMPAWLSSNALSVRLIGHWRTVPLASSGQ